MHCSERTSGGRQEAVGPLHRNLAAVFALSLAVVAPPAMAQTAAPQPSSCAGLAATDPANDQATTVAATPTNTDITGVFFRYAKNGAGNRVLTADIRVKDLNAEVFAPGTSTEWQVRFANPYATQHQLMAGARIDALGNVTYYLAADPVDAASSAATSFTLPTTGHLYEGPDGVIEIELPGFDGKTLTRVFAQALVDAGPVDRDGPAAQQADRAPDGTGFGTAYSVKPCVADEIGWTPTEPSSCAGYAATDPSGDATTIPDPGLGLTPSHQSDITGVFFRYAKDSSGVRRLTADLRVDYLEPSNGGEWFVRYAYPTAADERVAGARTDSDGMVKFYEGSMDPTASPVPERTTGRLLTGPNGIIEIDIPASRAGSTAKTLTNVFAESWVSGAPIDRDSYRFAHEADRAPDTGFGASFKVEPCLADEENSGEQSTS